MVIYLKKCAHNVLVYTHKHIVCAVAHDVCGDVAVGNGVGEQTALQLLTAV